MINKTILAVAITAFVCGASASGASAAPKGSDVMGSNAYPPVYAPGGVASPSDLFLQNNHASDAIPGVNPMTNAPAVPAAPGKLPYHAIPGVNPL